MAGWEQRAKKLEARRQRQQKHGRSLLTAVRAAEEKRLRELRKRTEEPDSAGRG